MMIMVRNNQIETPDMDKLTWNDLPSGDLPTTKDLSPTSAYRVPLLNNKTDIKRLLQDIRLYSYSNTN